jgi:hypothetical protein
MCASIRHFLECVLGFPVQNRDPFRPRKMIGKRWEIVLDSQAKRVQLQTIKKYALRSGNPKKKKEIIQTAS